MSHLQVVRDDQGAAGAYRPPIPRVPSRDWAIGPVTGHRLAVGWWVAFFMACFYALQHLIWPTAVLPVATFDVWWSWGSVLWTMAVPGSTFVLLGLLLYRYPNEAEMNADIPVSRLVVWRIVSKGENTEALLATVRRIQSEMKRAPLFPYHIEIVTDTQSIMVPPPNDDVWTVTVPKDFVLPKRTRFKARALHFAMEHSQAPDEAWLVHLDEETQPTLSGVKGIARMIAEEEASGGLRIGQGAVLYHRQWKTHPFLTLADNTRTGMDFGPFFFQTLTGRSLFGFHGSYIVVRNDVEKATGGFDFGHQGDITEDAWWALVANAAGHRIRWVHGYLEEQSTQSIGDFLRQRRRWFEGLIKVVRFTPVPLRYRLPLGICLSLWGVVCLSVLYSTAHLFYGFKTDPVIRAFANSTWAVYATMYTIGLRANLDEAGVTKRSERLFWLVAQVCCLPFFCAMEIGGVLYALCRPQNGFHVIKK